MVSRSSVHLQACFEPDQPAASAFRAIGRRLRLLGTQAIPRTHRVNCKLRLRSRAKAPVVQFDLFLTGVVLQASENTDSEAAAASWPSAATAALRSAPASESARSPIGGSSAVAGWGSHWHGTHQLARTGSVGPARGAVSSRAASGDPAWLPAPGPGPAGPIPSEDACQWRGRAGGAARPSRAAPASWRPPSPPAAPGPKLRLPLADLTSCRLCRAAGRLGRSGSG